MLVIIVLISVHLYDLIIFYQLSKTLYFKGSTSIFVYMFKKKNT